MKKTKFGERRTFTMSKKLGKIYSDYGRTVPPCVLALLPQLNSVLRRALNFGLKFFFLMSYDLRELDNWQ